MVRSRTARLAARFSVALLTVGLLGAGASPASVSAAPAPEDCDEHTISGARVGKGASEGKDPNSLSASQAAAMDKALADRVAQLKNDGTLDSSGEPTSGAQYVIDTYVHVITRADGSGNVTDKQIAAQMKVINDGYAGLTAAGAAATPFRFKLVDTDRTANDDWYSWSYYTDKDDAEAKSALHEGTKATLNIYIAGLEDGLLGYATFPQGPLATDGLVILNESMPGGKARPYNGGDTATHEIGHWLGLYHTFQNGCAGAGDHVHDTPAQDDGVNIFYCNESDDTCTAEGKDPVHNFMSYGDDKCLDRFTPGQSDRQVENWLAFRSGR